MPLLPESRDAALSLLTHAPEGMACFDRTQHLLWINEAFASMLGCPAQVLLGHSLAELDARLASRAVPADGAERSHAHCQLALSSHSAVNLRLLQGGHCVLRAQEQAEGGLLVSVTDMRPLQAHQEQRHDFLSVAAHELRNPVASIYGFAQLLRSRTLKPEGLTEVTEILCRQADSLSHLVEELLDLARIDAKGSQDFKLQTVSLSSLIQEAREALPPGLLPGRIHVRVAPSADLLQVDRTKVVRVLINVLSNALKYSPASTPVEISARRLKGVTGVTEIVVTDQGIGMSTEQQRRIFERFYRADPGGPIPGTGLGMSLVREIVTLHGGQVSVQSKLGQGSRIVLSLPMADTAPNGPMPGKKSGSQVAPPRRAARSTQA